MRIAVIGVGHVGLVTAGVLAAYGHTVIGIDHDRDKVLSLQRGVVPFHEPGLDDLLATQVECDRLTFTSDMRDALAGAEVAFVCVGTPALEDGAPNLSYVENVAVDVARHASNDIVLVEKSTVPATTGVRLEQVIHRERPTYAIRVASNPEFLREGTAVADTMRPDRIVIGAPDPVSAMIVRDVYEPMLDVHDCPVVETDVATAELIKHASNAFLATRISFINAVANICDRVGADVEAVADGMGHDHRIGRHFLNAGIGYGGSCFPKDVDAFYHLSRQVGYDFRLLDEVRIINDNQINSTVLLLRDELWHLEGKTVTLLGAAFKPGTDDLRRSPAIRLAVRLLNAGAHVRIYDPVAAHAAAEQLPEVDAYTDPMLALREAHAAIVCTEWDDIVSLPLADVAKAMRYPIVIDGRNVWEPATAKAAGLRYHGIGRGHVADHR